MSSPRTIRLNNGVAVPQVGFGVFQIPPDATRDAVESAIAAGYRHIDTAAAYNNEAGVGAAIRASGIPREEFFVTTKLRNGEQGRAGAVAAYGDSVQRLGLDYADLYLIHWPNPEAGLFVESWRGLERLYQDGRVRAIGVSNFLPEHLDTLLVETEVVPSVNQLEVHPTFQQRELLAMCRDHGIAVEAYSPLGRGQDLHDPVVVGIAAEHGVTPAQVILRWHVELGHIVIPKSVSPERVRSNIELDGLDLSRAEVEQISALDRGERTGNDPRTFSLSQIR
ncbi:MAG TPA: aldo/keto reductase [Propionibacteriaceae bacterium]|nr:aldo/keto reductase [Propionibacteriaceae bacterium]